MFFSTLNLLSIFHRSSQNQQGVSTPHLPLSPLTMTASSSPSPPPLGVDLISFSEDFCDFHFSLVKGPYLRLRWRRNQERCIFFIYRVNKIGYLCLYSSLSILLLGTACPLTTIKLGARFVHTTKRPRSRNILKAIHLRTLQDLKEIGM